MIHKSLSKEAAKIINLAVDFCSLTGKKRVHVYDKDFNILKNQPGISWKGNTIYHKGIEIIKAESGK